MCSNPRLFFQLGGVDFGPGLMFTDITLRDLFAGLAMQGMLFGAVGMMRFKEGARPSAYAHGSCNAVIADRAYTIADFMLSERERERSYD